jgi:hypothetical protein
MFFLVIYVFFHLCLLVLNMHGRVSCPCFPISSVMPDADAMREAMHPQRESVIHSVNQ